jgi:hypothetical protein
LRQEAKESQLTPIGHIGAGVVGALLLDTFVFHRPPTAETLGLTIGLSLLPDLDAPIVAVLRKNWPPKRRNDHHASFTPFFYLAIGLMLTPFLPVRSVVLFTMLTMLHLALDSWATDDGIMWLWPHTNRQYALLPVPLRDNDLYGWRYYRYHYFQMRRRAAWAEMWLAMLGLGLIAASFLPMLRSF